MSSSAVISRSPGVVRLRLKQSGAAQTATTPGSRQSMPARASNARARASAAARHGGHRQRRLVAAPAAVGTRRVDAELGGRARALGQRGIEHRRGKPVDDDGVARPLHAGRDRPQHLLGRERVDVVVDCNDSLDAPVGQRGQQRVADLAAAPGRAAAGTACKRRPEAGTCTFCSDGATAFTSEYTLPSMATLSGTSMSVRPEP